MTTSPKLGIPFISSQQNQPEVTHNTALVMLQAVLGGAIAQQDAPPGAPDDGDTYLVGTAGTGLWAGKDNKLATFLGGWVFLPGVDSDGADIPMGPDQEGLFIYLQGSGLVFWDGDAWVSEVENLSSGFEEEFLQVDGSNFMTGRLGVIPGTALLPGISTPADPSTGWRVDVASIKASLGGVESYSQSTTGAAGTTRLGAMPGFTHQLVVTGEGAATNNVFNYANATTGGQYFGQKARGTINGPVVINENDLLVAMRGNGYDGAAFKSVAEMQVICVEPVPSATAMGAQWRWTLAPVGSVTRAEIYRVSHEAGFSIFGANPVITNNRAIRFRSLTISAAQALTGLAVGDTFLASNAGGGNGLIVYDGTVFRRGQETGTNVRATDAAFTLTPLTDAPNQYCTGVLTAARAITLSATNAYDGAIFHITRTGAGAFNYTVAYGAGGGSTKNIAQDTWAKFEYDGANAIWRLQAAGAL